MNAFADWTDEERDGYVRMTVVFDDRLDLRPRYRGTGLCQMKRSRHRGLAAALRAVGRAADRDPAARISLAPIRYHQSFGMRRPSRRNGYRSERTEQMVGRDVYAKRVWLRNVEGDDE